MTEHAGDHESRISILEKIQVEAKAGFDYLRDDIRELVRNMAVLARDMGELKKGQDRLNEGQAELVQGQAELRTDMDGVKEGMAELRGGQAELRTDMDSVKEGLAKLEVNQTKLSLGLAEVREGQAKLTVSQTEFRESQGVQIALLATLRDNLKEVQKEVGGLPAWRETAGYRIHMLLKKSEGVTSKAAGSEEVNPV
ncbi:hypothetical protein [Acrocarpospora sp. B8E8]|uniref:hypothetical protein n=1 Tax=Acrocarpospora sp. B8E8 TaxID=3153572 RepID=UPI00325FBCC8